MRLSVKKTHFLFVFFCLQDVLTIEALIADVRYIIPCINSSVKKCIKMLQDIYTEKFIFSIYWNKRKIFFQKHRIVIF